MFPWFHIRIGPIKKLLNSNRIFSNKNTTKIEIEFIFHLNSIVQHTNTFYAYTQHPKHLYPWINNTCFLFLSLSLSPPLCVQTFVCMEYLKFRYEVFFIRKRIRKQAKKEKQLCFCSNNNNNNEQVNVEWML